MAKAEISYALLRNIRKQSTRQLYRLPNDFYHEVHSYIRELEDAYKELKSDEKAIRALQELNSTRRVLKEIVELRMGAISTAARGVVFTDISDKNFIKNLQSEEVQIYKRFIQIFEESEDKLCEVDSEEIAVEQPIHEQPIKDKEEVKEKRSRKIVRILDEIDNFADTDGVYHKLYKRDLITLPQKTAELLVKTKKAEFVG